MKEKTELNGVVDKIRTLLGITNSAITIENKNVIFYKDGIKYIIIKNGDNYVIQSPENVRAIVLIRSQATGEHNHKNKVLSETIEELANNINCRRIDFIYCKSHDGNLFHEKADALARTAIGLCNMN